MIPDDLRKKGPRDRKRQSTQPWEMRHALKCRLLEQEIEGKSDSVYSRNIGKRHVINPMTKIMGILPKIYKIIK